ncbi:MAG: ABC transporter substrate-binding protein [Syntrophomonas sp.]|nr:ABC transporter substrate-binding protein [Syntrophomonas sp.]
MQRIMLLFMVMCLFIFSMAGCTPTKSKDAGQGSSPELINVKTAVLRGPTAVGMIKMMDEKPSLGDNVKVDYLIEQNPDTLSAKLLTGEIELATIPTNMAAKLYNKGAGYQMAAMNTWGVMYVLAQGVTIDNWKDLRGQQVDAAGQGAASDLVFKYLLAKNGLDPEKDLTIKYIASPVEQAQLAIAGKSRITVLPEPWISTVINKNQDMQIVLDMQKEWTRINGAEVPFAQTCLVVKTDFASQHPDIMARFLQEYAKSLAWVNQNTADAGDLVKKHDIGIPADVAAAAIPRLNLKYMSSIEAKTAVEKYLQVLLEFSPDSIGGKLPDAKFYYQK